MNFEGNRMKMKVTTQSSIPRRLAQFFSGPIMGVMAVLLPLSVAISQSLATVDLGSTANFAVLAGTAATFTTSTINGDIGVSPGLAITMTTSVHKGTTYTGVGSSAGTAQEDLTTAYNDAAGRDTPTPTVNPGTAGGEIGGMNLGPGLYKFTTTAAISSVVTLTGSATDVWIFQIGSTLIVAADVDVILAGGALASNIFWQVGTYATIAGDAIFEGTIMANDYITLAAGATLNGRALARSAAVTSTTNTITVTTTTDKSLPVTLSAFSARAGKGSVQLNWSTASEIENLGFILERRVTESEYQNWIEIASYVTNPVMAGQGSTSKRTEYSYTDESIEPGIFYEYRLADVSYQGTFEYHSMTVLATATAPALQMPSEYSMQQNYPNPFNPTTTISYGLPEEADISLVIYDIRGHVVKTIDSGGQVAGWYEHVWRGLDNSGQPVSTGLYLTRLQAGSHTKTIKMLYLK